MINTNNKQTIESIYLGIQLGVDLSTSHVENSFIGTGLFAPIVIPVNSPGGGTCEIEDDAGGRDFAQAPIFTPPNSAILK